MTSRGVALRHYCLACLLLMLLAGAGLADPPAMLQFMKARDQRAWQPTPRRVLAFYYTWYGPVEQNGSGRHWGRVNATARDIEASRDYPVGGAYNSMDPAVIDRHIHEAKACGIDGFICTWWGQGTYDDQAFALVLDRAAAQDFHATIYWETAPHQGEEQLRQAARDLLYVLNRYASHPAFLKIDGKPVIFVYGRVMGQMPPGAWPALITEVEQRYGSEVVLIADGFQELYARLFDGVHSYAILDWLRGLEPAEVSRAAQEHFTAAVALARSQGRVSCVTVMPGYDDTKVRSPGLRVPRHDGQLYRALWEQAIAADPDWVLITSFNEWHEGSEIETSVEYGDLYLRLTEQFARRFTALPPRPVSRPQGPRVPSRYATELGTLFAGKPIGILPGWSGASVLWLADADLELRELSPEDLLRPDLLHPTILPVLLYASHERYCQTVRDPGDADRALLNYLHAGGTLVVMSTGPYPFYYNEKGEPVRMAATFGLPMGSPREWLRSAQADPMLVANWEQPPEGVELTFHFDTQALPELPPTAPFPANGDRRWRPATVAMTTEGDEYEALATLRDGQGRSYGEGICLVRHVHSEPRGARVLYVWMRMADVVGRDELMTAIFRLAAGRR